MGCSGAPLVASETRAKMAQVVSGKHWNLGAEGWAAAASSSRAGVSSPAAAAARASSLLHTSWLGQLTCSQLFSKQVFLISHKKPSMELVAINRKVPSSVGNTCTLPASLCCVGQPIAL